MNDTSLWAEALSMQGTIKLKQQLYPQAEQDLLQAHRILGNFEQNGIRSDIAAALSSLYSRVSNGRKAIEYAKQNIKLQKDSLHCYRAFLLLGNAYYKVEQYDSASYYLNKALPSQSYTNRANAYMHLADIAKKRGEITQSLEMERLYSSYKDSMNLLSQRDKVLEIEKQVLIKQQQIQYEHSQSKYRYYVIVLTVITISFIYFLRK